MLRDYPSLYTQIVLGVPYKMLGIKPKSEHEKQAPYLLCYLSGPWSAFLFDTGTYL